MPKNDKKRPVVLSELAKQLAADIQTLEAEFGELLKEKQALDEQHNTLKQRNDELKNQFDHRYDSKITALSKEIDAREKENKVLAQQSTELNKNLEALEDYGVIVLTLRTAPREISEHAQKIAEIQDKINNLEQEHKDLVKEIHLTSKQIQEEESKFILLRDDKKINEFTKKRMRLEQGLSLNEAGGVDIMTRKPIAELQKDIADMQQFIQVRHEQYEGCKTILTEATDLAPFLQGTPLGNLDDEKYLRTLHQQLLSQTKQATESLENNTSKISSNNYQIEQLRNDFIKYYDVNKNNRNEQNEISAQDFQLKQKSVDLDLKILDKRAELNGLKSDYEKENQPPVEQANKSSPKKTIISAVKASLFRQSKNTKPLDKDVHKHRGPGRGTQA